MNEFIPRPDSQSAFRDALGQFTTGITVVTCHTEDGPVGITANSFASVSLSPPLVLWSPAKSSARFASFEAAQKYAIHVLSDTQEELCNRFTRGGRDFSSVDMDLDPSNVPLIKDCLARFECTQTAIHDAGDHAIIVGEVSRITTCPGNPLVFSKGQLGRYRPGV